MELWERIGRRISDDRNRLIVDENALNPAVRPDEPIGHGPIIERLLDVLDPAFSGSLPPSCHVYGPRGSGKSVLVANLFQLLSERFSPGDAPIVTTTRTTNVPRTEFVYVDARGRTTFETLRGVLDALTDETTPKRGISLDDIEWRLTDAVAATERTVLAIDHVSESRSGTIRDHLPANVPISTVTVDRQPMDTADSTVRIPAYSSEALLDILFTRASSGLSSNGLKYALTREIGDWAAGDATKAITALYAAAIFAERDGATNIGSEHVGEAIETTPDRCIHVETIASLHESKQTVLDRFVTLNLSGTEIDESAESIAADVTLSEKTVKRHLYELAQDGVLTRIRTSGNGPGRPPTRLEPRFSPPVYRRLRGQD
ncbi:Cdc6/Cdc18 family protein [Natronosalvus halobius]|uniref:Cdc6/Cdc18 family protein n=1 Tax=Natronosalvus halobius TaxID=2953746 RepID=UPI00209EF350|nr:AAA family ATPase [Natronosalvus halobius]USZ72108.1 AAA family ATPase [Natronosalvus halobius]